MQNEQVARITEEELSVVLREVEEFVDGRLAKYSWKIIGFGILPLVAMAVAWGSLTLQVNKNTVAIETSVLTVKDKDNLDIKINNLADKIDTNNKNVLEAIQQLRVEVRNK